MGCVCRTISPGHPTPYSQAGPHLLTLVPTCSDLPHLILGTLHSNAQGGYHHLGWHHRCPGWGPWLLFLPSVGASLLTSTLVLCPCLEWKQFLGLTLSLSLRQGPGDRVVGAEWPGLGQSVIPSHSGQPSHHPHLLGFC